MDNTSVFERSPWRAIASLSVPSLVSVLVMILYNIADMYFVGWLGDLNQTAAVSLAGPVYSVMMAISTMIGNGGCTRIAQALGRHDAERVRSDTALCVWASVAFGVLCALVCALGQGPLLSLLGTNGDTREYTRAYTLILAAGAPVLLLNHSLGGALRGEGQVTMGLIGSFISTVGNILLDPLFIIVLKLGAAGAAIATVLGNALAVAYYLLCRWKRPDRCVIELRPGYAKDIKALGSILALGLPNAVSSLLGGISGTFSNRLLVGYGTGAVAAMAAAGKGVLVVTMVQMGICMGVQPLLAYCYGGRSWEKLKGVVKRVLLLTAALGAALTLLLWFGRGSVIGLFIKDAGARALGEQLSGYLLLMGPFVGVYYLSSNLLQACGSAAGASVASALRQGLLLIPLLYLMESLLGLTGLALAHTLADGISIAATSVMAVRHYRRVIRAAGEPPAETLPAR